MDKVLADVPDEYAAASWFRRIDGDSATLALPAAVPKPWIAADLIRLMKVALRQANRHFNDDGRLRLRAAVDHGDLVVGDQNIAGVPVHTTARLIDSEDLRNELRRSPQDDLALIVSDRFYHEVVGEEAQDLDARTFYPTDFEVKGNAVRGWIRRGAAAHEAGVPGNPPIPHHAEPRSTYSARSEHGTAIAHLEQTGETITNDF
ncbi:hypothetical protein CF165_26930 [Amycolatopsis vastitatis]|uniref:Uncharacterized protein n=1 Tax=Amycolatopsis vastitatis TaxID=1905142 RepID=A0A229SY52_9PSEU|nr:hypothetical protein CF165_26930 [Amycolatopsis vastitatis]